MGRGIVNVAQSVFINGVHLFAVIVGFMLIDRLARSEKYARLFWPVTLAFAGAVALFLFLVSDPGSAFEDFRKAYWKAGVAVLQGPQNLAHLFADNVFGFVNLPILAYVFAPFGLLPEKPAGVAFALIGLAATWFAWDRGSALFNLTRAQRALALFAMAAYGPLIHSLRQDNTSHIVLALVIWGVERVKAKSPYLAGAIFGLAALVKPPLLLIGVYFALSRQWRVVFGGATTVALGAALSILIFGWDLHREWFETCIRPFLGGVVAAFNDQSIAAGLARFELGTRVLWDWNAYMVSPLTRALQWVSCAVLLGVTLWARLKAGKRDVEIDIAQVLVLACLLSTLSWSHYFVWLLPAFALLFVATAPGGVEPGLRPALIGVYALAAPAEFLSAPMRDGSYPFALVLTSHLLLAGLATFVLLIAVRLRTPATLRANSANSPNADALA
jgi:alpha-1,2-mannosyltransferase